MHNVVCLLDRDQPTRVQLPQGFRCNLDQEWNQDFGLALFADPATHRNLRHTPLYSGRGNHQAPGEASGVQCKQHRQKMDVHHYDFYLQTR